MYPIFCKVGKGYKPWVFMVIDVISEVWCRMGSSAQPMAHPACVGVLRTLLDEQVSGCL